MNLLVTGGAGFIGSNFIQFVLAQNDRPASLINLDRLTYAGNPANLAGCEAEPGYCFVEGDICDRDLIEKLLNEHAIDAVVHFAAESHVDRSIDAPEDFIQTNVVGTFRLLEAFRKYAKDKKDARFLHVSTDEVFGSLEPNAPAFSEATPYAPSSPYSASKAASDHLVRAYVCTYGLPLLMTNCSNNYGPYQFPEKLIPLMILNALDEKPLPVYGDGMNIRDWLYVQDHCSAVWEVLKCGRLGETYNIGGNCERTNLAVLEELCLTLDRIAPRENGGSYLELKTFVPDRPGHDRRYAMNAEKIMNELNWKPQETLSTGLEKTVRWYLDNRDWCEAVHQKYQRQRLGAGT